MRDFNAQIGNQLVSHVIDCYGANTSNKNGKLEILQSLINKKKQMGFQKYGYT